jgi:triosephosphate isomerase
MTKTRAEALAWAHAVRDAVGAGVPCVQPFVLPPATALAEVAAAFGPGSPVLVGAQNAHWADAGAWTGELSVPQVADAGAALVEIGHSERREHFAETDDVVRRKVAATLRHGLVALLCCGEPAGMFAAGESVRYVLAQVESALAGVADLDRVVIAYEPVWAIGEHGRRAEPAEVAGVHAELAARWGGRVRAVLHGGSVRPSNAAALLALPGVDGVFVGRAAWDPDGFLALLDVARSHAETSLT